MKKKAPAKKSATKRSVKRTSPRSSTANQTLLFRRIVIISACLVMVVGLFATFDKGSVSRAVAGASITRGIFMQATIQISPVLNASSYNIYYKQSGDQNFTNAVRNIPSNVQSYTISYLKRNVEYQYVVATVVNGKEVSFTPVKTLTNLQSM
jgi:hypothetical protein